MNARVADHCAAVLLYMLEPALNGHQDKVFLLMLIDLNQQTMSLEHLSSLNVGLGFVLLSWGCWDWIEKQRSTPSAVSVNEPGKQVDVIKRTCRWIQESDDVLSDKFFLHGRYNLSRYLQSQASEHGANLCSRSCLA